jgi:hypothetical protein
MADARAKPHAAWDGPMSSKGQECVGVEDPRELRGGGGGGGPHTGYLGDERANPHAARDDAILPLLCRGSPLARHPQLLVYLLPTTWILS